MEPVEIAGGNGVTRFCNFGRSGRPHRAPWADHGERIAARRPSSARAGSGSGPQSRSRSARLIRLSGAARAPPAAAGRAGTAIGGPVPAASPPKVLRLQFETSPLSPLPPSRFSKELFTSSPCSDAAPPNVADRTSSAGAGRPTSWPLDELGPGSAHPHHLRAWQARTSC